MIYLKQQFNPSPASPGGLDNFIALAEKALVPAWSRAGGRLLGAWSSTDEWFFQVTQVTAFEDLAAYDRARNIVADDAELAGYRDALNAAAPICKESLLEPLGPVSADKIDEAIEASADAPAGIYAFAILEVEAGKMEAFQNLLGMGAANLPIIGAWRDVAGNPNQVTDLWSGDPAGRPYAPNSPAMDAFFVPLRELAPKERVVRLRPLPYSPLQ